MKACRSLISLLDLSRQDLQDIQDLVTWPMNRFDRILDGKVVGLFFNVTSTRTRSAFWRAALDMGAGVMSFGPGDLQVNTGESYADTGRVLSSVTDHLVVRTNGPDLDFRHLASVHPSVVNAMSRSEHPTQALADLAAIREHFGPDAPIRLSYFGEGNNTAAALALLLSSIPGAVLRFYCPPGHGLGQNVIDRATASANDNGAEIHALEEIPDTLPKANVVYTTRWQTMGVPHTEKDWRDRFAPFRVDARLFARAADSHGVFMHDLPAVRGDETTGEVLDGAHSIAWRQAFHKVTAAKIALAWCSGVNPIALPKARPRRV